MSILSRNNVQVFGNENQPVLLYAHGFGCSQDMWNQVVPKFLSDYRQVLFDFVGSGKSDISQYRVSKYSSLHGYAQDIIDVCDALDLERDIVFVGHSVSCSIAVLAALQRPELFKAMILVGPSPCFLNHPPEYMGGFEKADLEGLLELMDQNYIGWAEYLAPVVAGAANDPTVQVRLSDSFCSTDPLVAKHFARATFFADNRDDFSQVKCPTLILQHRDDALAPLEVGKFVQQQILGSELIVLDVSGHAAHMSHPDLVVSQMRDFLDKAVNT